MLVNGWYINNLIAIGPHSKDLGEAIKLQKLEEIRKDKGQVKLLKDFWKGFKPRVEVVISGENVNLAKEMETRATFIGLEVDPVRRTALIEEAMTLAGIDVEGLPKSEPQQQPQAQPILSESQPQQ